MRARRAGRVTDGDEVEVVGRWSRGTLHASKIKNLTTASEVIGFPRWLKWAVLAVFLAVIAGGAAAVMSGGLPALLAGRVVVPDVVGLNEMAAFSKLGQAGLIPDSTTESSDSVAQGLVIRTTPQAAVEVDRASSVLVVVSSGAGGQGAATFAPPPPPPTEPPAPAPVLVPVPGLAGLDEAAAVSALADAGLSSRTTTESSETVPEGAVIRTDPGAGSMLDLDAKVMLFISSGPAEVAETQAPAADVPVPAVAGMAQADAEANIVAAGLGVAIITEGFCLGTPPLAVRTDPAADTLVPEGSVVTLVATC